MTYPEAQRNAKRIQEFWASLGYDVRVTVVQDRANAVRHDAAPWVIHTNLVNGLPPKAKPDIHEQIMQQITKAK